MNFRDSAVKKVFKNFFFARNKNIVVLEPHMGLGDSLICLGLIRAISDRAPDKCFYYACYPQYYHSLAWMFQDLKNVFLLPLNSGREARQVANFWNVSYLPIGINDVDIQRFDEFFYQQHQVPFELHWSNSDVLPGPRSESLYEELNPLNEKFILICNVGSGGCRYNLKIDNPENKKIISVFPATNNIFDWTKLALLADEILTIDTSFVHFIESLFYRHSHKSFYYHRARKSFGEFSRRLPWQIVNYDNQ